MDPRLLTFRSERVGDEVTLTVGGEIDLATAESLYERASALVDASARVLALDLADVTFCDSLGVAALVRIYRHADGLGCRLRVTNVRGHIAHVLRISGLDQVFEIQAADRTA
jgi:anti-sigma B factor antagonist